MLERLQEKKYETVTYEHPLKLYAFLTLPWNGMGYPHLPKNDIA